MTEPTQEEVLKKVDAILADPKNEQANPKVYAEAKAYKEKVSAPRVDPVLQDIQSRFGNGYASKEDFYTVVDKHLSGAHFAEVIGQLPEPVVEIVKKAANNDPSWKEAFGGRMIDYEKSYSDDELLKIYNPNLFTAEELASEDEAVKKSISAAKTASKKQFLIEKQERGQEKQLSQQRKEYTARKAKDSLEVSIANWKANAKKLNPNISESQLNTMESRMRSELSTGNFVRKFVNEDGTYTEEAASLLFPVSFGSEFTGAWKNMGRMEAEKGVHDIVDRGGKPREFNREAPPIPQESPIRMFQETRKNPFVIK